MNSTQLRSYLTGLILGDGYIDKGVTKRGFCLKTINKEWANKIFNDLKSCTNFTILLKNFNERIGKDGVHHKPYYEICIKSHPYFNKKYNYFYDDRGRRRIRREAIEWLDLNGIANWYMSDGYICLVGKTKGIIRNRRIDLCTDRYSKSDIELLQKKLYEKYNWDTSIIQRKQNTKVFYRLRFTLKSAQDLFVKINPYIPQSMKYKLNMKYDYRPTWMTEEYFNLMKEIEKCESPTANLAEEQDIV